VIPAFVPLNKLFQKERHVALLQITAPGVPSSMSWPIPRQYLHG
jgi:hypothetical protein